MCLPAACNLSNLIKGNAGVANKSESDNTSAKTETDTSVQQGAGSKTTIFNVSNAGVGLGSIAGLGSVLLALSRHRHRKALEAVCTEIEGMQGDVSKLILKGRISKATSQKSHGKLIHKVVKNYRPKRTSNAKVRPASN